MFEKIQNMLEKFVNPLAEKLSSNQSLTAVSQGFVKLMPLTLGVAAIMIISNLPIPAFTAWLDTIGIKSDLDAVLTASTSIIALFISFTIAYSFASNRKQKALNAGLISMSSFLVVTPQVVTVGEETAAGFTPGVLGSNGIFVAIIISLIVGHLYCWLSEKNIKLKLPASVPPMVSDSLEPVFVSMIIFALMAAIRIAFHFSPFGTMHEFTNLIITKPLMGIGTSIPALIFVIFLANLFWFFGIHPSTVQSAVTPMIYTMLFESIDKFNAGEPLTYTIPLLIYSIANLGAAGNTLGLVISMFTAKSERYKSLFKLSVIPHLFNINEPLIFGVPIMLNPIFFLPMTLTSVITALISWVYLSVVGVSFNPNMSLLPWTTPVVIKYFFMGGIRLGILGLILVAVSVTCYYPFFRIADKNALAEEKEIEEGAE